MHSLMVQEHFLHHHKTKLYYIGWPGGEVRKWAKLTSMGTSCLGAAISLLGASQDWPGSTEDGLYLPASGHWKSKPWLELPNPAYLSFDNVLYTQFPPKNMTRILGNNATTFQETFVDSWMSSLPSHF